MMRTNMNCMRNTRARWSPLSIGLMDVGFLVAWPLGLAILAYILSGDHLRTAFDEHRKHELYRLEEERRKLDSMPSSLPKSRVASAFSKAGPSADWAFS